MSASGKGTQDEGDESRFGVSPQPNNAVRHPRFHKNMDYDLI